MLVYFKFTTVALSYSFQGIIHANQSSRGAIPDKGHRRNVLGRLRLLQKILGRIIVEPLRDALKVRPRLLPLPHKVQIERHFKRPVEPPRVSNIKPISPLLRLLPKNMAVDELIIDGRSYSGFNSIKLATLLKETEYKQGRVMKLKNPYNPNVSFHF